MRILRTWISALDHHLPQVRTPPTNSLPSVWLARQKVYPGHELWQRSLKSLAASVTWQIDNLLDQAPSILSSSPLSPPTHFPLPPSISSCLDNVLPLHSAGPSRVTLVLSSGQPITLEVAKVRRHIIHTTAKTNWPSCFTLFSIVCPVSCAYHWRQ